MFCNYLTDIFIEKVNTMLQAVVRNNGKRFGKLEIKIDHVVNNVD